MTATPTQPRAPADKRLKLLEVAIKKLQYQPDALIEVLHKAQELFGFLEIDILRFVARQLKLPPSRVYGVATFYHLFSLRPKGEHTCVVCLGTACYVKGADRLLAAIEEFAGIKAGQTTADDKVSLLTARCVGACGIAPVVVYDNVTAGQVTAPAALEHLKGWGARGSH